MFTAIGLTIGAIIGMVVFGNYELNAGIIFAALVAFIFGGAK